MVRGSGYYLRLHTRITWKLKARDPPPHSDLMSLDWAQASVVLKSSGCSQI